VTAYDDMLDAHVRFEVDRLTGEDLETSVRTEVSALFDWLAEVSLDDLATAQDVIDAAFVGIDAVSSADLEPYVTETLVGLKASLASSPDTVADVVNKDDVVRWATSLATMDDARGEIIDQVTTSKAYSRLVAHVVYQGVKSYVLTENALAKKIPGASSLVRLGQRGITAAAPSLEQNVDRQLIAFVDANIADTIRDSRRFIDSMMNPDTVATMAGDAWTGASDRPVASLADLLTDDELQTLSELAWRQWQSLSETDLVRQLIAEAVAGFFAAHGARPVSEVLADLGIDAEVVVQAVLPVALTGVQHAADSGYLEDRVRDRLAAFYESYEA
jgi:hypothetical protein